MFIRRLFYDLDNGNALCSYAAEGYIKPFEHEREAEVRGLTNWGVLEWVEPDPEIEAAFANVDAEGNPRIVTVTVDISGAEPKLVFSYAPAPEPGESETADMAAALALLGVVPEGGA